MASVTRYKRKGKADGWRGWAGAPGHERESRVFDLKTDAKTWAVQREAEMKSGGARPGGRPAKHTMADALQRYAKEISPEKRGQKEELARLNAMARELPFTGQQIGRVTAEMINAWARDRRASGLTNETVRRELGLLGQVFKVARLPWRWIAANPMKEGIQRPPQGKPRTRVATPAEIAALTAALDYQEGAPPAGPRAQVAYAYLIALEMGLRSKECLLLTVGNLHLDQGYVRVVDDNKTATERFAIATPRAVELLTTLRDAAVHEGRERLFSISPEKRDKEFQAAKKRAGVVGLTFHDSRRAATTAMAKKLTLLELQSTTGIKTIAILAKTYYSADPAEAAAKLRKEPT